MATALPFLIKPITGFTSANCDGVVIVSWPNAKHSDEFNKVIQDAAAIDNVFESEVSVLKSPAPYSRIIHSPTGPIDPDYDDVRILSKAVAKGIRRAIRAGVKKPVLVLQKHESFPDSELVMLLAALEELHMPLHYRETTVPSKVAEIEYLGVFSQNPKVDDVISLAINLEIGRVVARDIGGSDPERMAPPRVEEYVKETFKNSNIEVKVVSDSATLTNEYPLFQAVNRCAEHVERHKGRIIFLTYSPNSATIDKTLMFVGKGVTYDTGGADVKVGGAMEGMSRDKCGAAAVAGFLKVVSLLEPPNIKIVAALCMVRNSIGSDSYVADEIIVARSGVRVRVKNTDAEGRMAMADALCELKDLAKNEVNPHLYTIATLTGHACLAMGMGYSIVMDNGPAKRRNHATTLQNSADMLGDPFEISMIRKEDIEFNLDTGKGVDIAQSNTMPSVCTKRGHQCPAGFLLHASGLIKHGSGADIPIAYSHLDIAASAGCLPDEATGSPILALSKMLLL